MSALIVFELHGLRVLVFVALGFGCCFMLHVCIVARFRVDLELIGLITVFSLRIWLLRIMLMPCGCFVVLSALGWLLEFAFFCLISSVCVCGFGVLVLSVYLKILLLAYIVVVGLRMFNCCMHRRWFYGGWFVLGLVFWVLISFACCGVC